MSLGFCRLRISSSNSLVLWDLVHKFWPLRAWNMILGAYATQNALQTDDVRTLNVRNIFITVTFF